MDNNTPTTVLSAEQMAQQLWPIPQDMSYDDTKWMEIFRNKFIQGWNARNEEVKELIGALEKLLIQAPEADFNDHKRLYNEAYNTLTKYTNK